METIRQALLRIARAEIGYIEKTGNFTKYGQWFGLDGVPWCGIFMSWIYTQVNRGIPHVDFPKGFASVPAMYQYAKKNDLITEDPQPGDLVILDWQKGKVTENDWSADHVEMFESWTDRSAGTFSTVGGNTSPKNLSNGGMVQEGRRNTLFVQAFVRILKAGE